MNTIKAKQQKSDIHMNPLFKKDAFLRLDENDDSLFYSTDRFVNHLDSFAQATVRHIIGELVTEENPVILDLMAGWDSHIPNGLAPSRVVGLGLNENELRNNNDLTETIIHDINQNPTLPFPSNTFDVVLNTVSVDYMTKPIAVFREVGRILKPGGLFLVIFSNRMFPQKAVKIWREADEDERIILVQDFFKKSEIFEKPILFISRGKPRPESDKYAHLGIPSDPVYAWYADKKDPSTAGRKRPDLTFEFGEYLEHDERVKREENVKTTLRCPHCGARLKKWAVPDNPFCQTWDNDFMYICFNDLCDYYVRGWDFMYKEANKTMSYRCMYNPEKNRCMPIPVPSPRALREGIID